MAACTFAVIGCGGVLHATVFFLMFTEVMTDQVFEFLAFLFQLFKGA
ncbi:hypothetical protein Q4551_07930 [Oceanobacter sp. 5_MG-2023]|nr:hypothetical protein [Oceanobacter sp. 5_MG-2023]